MGSLLKTNKWNFEDQYFEKFGLPMIICNSHKNSAYECINLNNLSENKLVCDQCIIKNRLNYECLINIKDFFSKNPNNIIKNWPPMQDPNIYEQLTNDAVQVSEKSQSIEQINRYFDKLKLDVLKIIEDHQKKILSHINSMEEKRKNVVDVYNQISTKDEIRNEFLKNIDNQPQLEIYLKQIISKQQNQSNQNQSNIQNALDQYTKYQKNLQFDYIQTLFEQSLVDLKSIDLLNPDLKRQQYLQQSKISDENKDQEEENKLCLKVDKIMKLINNKSNFCNQNFLDNLKDILMMNKQIFTQIDLNNPFLEKNEPIQFECLNQNQLQQMAHIFQSLNRSQQVNTIQEYQLKKTIFEDCLMQVQDLFKGLNEMQKMELLDSITFKDTKIVKKKQENQYQNDINEIDLLESLKILKTMYKSPDEIQLNIIENNYQQIEKSSGDMSQVVLNEELIGERKYQIQIDINNINSDKTCIYLGLLSTQQNQYINLNSRLQLFFCGCGKELHKTESGMRICELKSIKQISFQICLKEKIFRCLCIQNNAKNINSQLDLSKIKPNDNYYFYITIIGKSSLTIKQFKIIKEFEKW